MYTMKPIRCPKRGGGAEAGLTRKEAAAEEARVQALGFELWCKVPARVITVDNVVVVFLAMFHVCCRYSHPRQTGFSSQKVREAL